MALTVGFQLQGTTPTTVDATDYIQFAGATFDSAIAVGSYNDSTHVESSAGADDSSGNTPNNVKYIASGTADWGDGTESLSSMTTGEATLKVTVTYDSAITISDAQIYAYDGTTTTTAPTGMDVYLAEQGDSAWTNADGSAAACSLDDKSSGATNQYYYIAASASPSSVGEKASNKIRLEFTYQ